MTPPPLISLTSGITPPRSPPNSISSFINYPLIQIVLSSSLLAFASQVLGLGACATILCWKKTLSRQTYSALCVRSAFRPNSEAAIAPRSFQILSVSVLERCRESTCTIPVSKEINKNHFSCGLLATPSHSLSASLCWWEQFPDTAILPNGWWAQCKYKFLLAGWAAGLSLRKSVKQYHERNGSTLQTNQMKEGLGLFHVFSLSLDNM